MKRVLMALLGSAMLSSVAFAQPPVVETTALQGGFCDSKENLEVMFKEGRRLGNNQSPEELIATINTRAGKTVCRWILKPTLFELQKKKIGSISDGETNYDEYELIIRAIDVLSSPGMISVPFAAPLKSYVVFKVSQEGTRL